MRVLKPDSGAEYSLLFDVIKGAAAYRMGRSQEEPGIRVISDHLLEVELEEPAGVAGKKHANIRGTDYYS